MPKPGDNTTYGFNVFDATATIKMIGNGDETYPEGRPRGGGGGGQSRIMVTPSGGIAALTGTVGGTLTPGSATCTEYEFSSGTWIPTTDTHTVYNVSDQPIAGSVAIKATKVRGGVYVVDVAGCGTAGQSFANWGM